MKVTMIDAMSANGFITSDSIKHQHEWTSAEDWDFFVSQRDSSDVMIMGARTYEAVKPSPSASLLRIVLTHHPEDYEAQAVKGQLEFVTSTPEALIGRLAREGYQSVLLAGGGQVNHDFLAANVVDDVLLTFEPALIGAGTPLMANSPLHVALTLQEVRQLNSKGTLLAHYTVDK